MFSIYSVKMMVTWYRRMRYDEQNSVPKVVKFVLTIKFNI